MYKLMLVVLISLNFTTSLPAAGKALLEPPDAPTDSVTVLKILEELGERYDRFFTIEEAWTESEPLSRIEDITVQRPSAKGSLFQNLDELRKLVPRLTFLPDKQNPRIIHVSDSRLAQQNGYGLDQIIKSIDFEGTVFDLVNVIALQGIHVSSRGPIDTSKIVFIDFSTKVHVKGQGLRVREALSNFIQLDMRSNRILWISETKIGPGQTTYVRFH